MRDFIEENQFYCDNRDERVVSVSDLETHMDGKVVVDAKAYKNLLKCKKFIADNQAELLRLMWHEEVWIKSLIATQESNDVICENCGGKNWSASCDQCIPY